MSGAIHSGCDHVELKDASDKIIKAVLPKMGSPLSALREFAPATAHFKAEGVDGSQSQAGLTADIDRANMEAGISDNFSTWIATLDDAGAKAAATLLWDIAIGTYDEDMRYIPSLVQIAPAANPHCPLRLVPLPISHNLNL